MGSVRFGLFENFKKKIAHYKGTSDAPAVLTIPDKALAAFATGIFSSFLVVPYL